MDTIGDILQAAIQIAWIGLFFTALGIVFLVPLVLVVFTFMDIFARDDIQAGKLVWLLMVLLVPFAGLGIYWLTKPASHQAPLSTTAMHRGTEVPEPAARESLPRAA
jgi:hypothetical protein